MNSRPQHGVLVISIDAAFGETAPAADRLVHQFDAIRNSTTWLLELLDELELPATWFFTDATMSLAPRVSAAPTQHEIGLLLGRNAGSKQHERSTFSRSLQRRFSVARAYGIDILTLGIPGKQTIAHLDLLAKHGVATVRQPVAAGSDRLRGWRCVEPLRFGICNLAATIQSHCASPWQQLTHGWTISRHLQKSAFEQEYCHLTIDIGSIVTDAARRKLRRTLRIAARHFAGRSQARPAQVLTMAAVTNRLAERFVGRRAQSILRAA